RRARDGTWKRVDAVAFTLGIPRVSEATAGETAFLQRLARPLKNLRRNFLALALGEQQRLNDGCGGERRLVLTIGVVPAATGDLLGDQCGNEFFDPAFDFLVLRAHQFESAKMAKILQGIAVAPDANVIGFLG